MKQTFSLFKKLCRFVFNTFLVCNVIGRVCVRACVLLCVYIHRVWLGGWAQFWTGLLSSALPLRPNVKSGCVLDHGDSAWTSTPPSLSLRAPAPWTF